MAKIFFLMGKSSCGKDTIYNKLLRCKELGLKSIVTYTTRPMREGEENGREYFFETEEQALEHINDGSVIEMRVYNTVHGPWRYYTVADGQVDIDGDEKYITIGTLESYNKYCEFFGNAHLYPIYIEIDNGERLQRALNRTRADANPKYTEMCRRFIADEEDFSEENIKKSKITRRFYNNDLDVCIAEITGYVLL